MSDTNTFNGTHEVHEVNGSTGDTGAQESQLDVVARAAKTDRARFVQRIDQLDAQRREIADRIAQLRAEVERCDRILGLASKDVKPRGRKPATKNVKR